MFCSNCGSRIPEGARFCASCGAPAPAPTASASAPVAAPAEGYWGATPNAAVTTGWELAPARVEYAGFWRRFVAMIIDWFVVSFVYYALVFIVMIAAVAGGTGSSGTASDAFGGLFALGSLVGNWLYFALMESSSMQATLGKKALGIVVTDVNGQRIGFGRATGRYFAKIISSIILLIGYIMAAFTEKKQGLHDMIAGTLVVMSQPAGSRGYPPATPPSGDYRQTQQW